MIVRCLPNTRCTGRLTAPVSFIVRLNMAPLLPDDQIRALLTGRAFSIVRAMSGDRQLSGKEYAQVFTVSRSDVLAYVRQHGFPKGSYSDRPRITDGPYMVEEEGKYVVYHQERGIRVDEASYSNKALADEAMVNLLLGLSGTGLYGRA
jgi:hypothetical protein